MDSLLNRYRNITVLLLVIVGQLVLLAVQVKNDQDVRFIRVWTITAVTPFARIVEGIRGGGESVFSNYIRLHDADAENRRLRDEVGRLKMDNIFLRNQLSEADRVKALQMFQAETQSKTIGARVIGVAAAGSARMVYVDRGSAAGVQRGMGVVTPDGIVGKVIAAYPTASQVLLVTDQDFAAGVVSQKNQARGSLKGTGKDYCAVDYVPVSEKVEVGEWFYTSGEDRIFPRGFPVGIVKEVKDSQPFKEIIVEPSGPRKGLEDVLIILNGVHQEIPPTPPTDQPVYIAPPPPPAPGEDAAVGSTGVTGTAADKLRARYKAIGDAQNHVFGEGLPGSKPPNFNLALPATGATAGAVPDSKQPAAEPKPSAPKTAPTGASGATTHAPAKQPAQEPKLPPPAAKPPAPAANLSGTESKPAPEKKSPAAEPRPTTADTKQAPAAQKSPAPTARPAAAGQTTSAPIKSNDDTSQASRMKRAVSPGDGTRNSGDTTKNPPAKNPPGGPPH